MATWIRRTLIFTSAPIFSSFSRMLPQLARANWVKAKPIRRSAQSSTLGKRGEPQAQLIGPHGGGRGAVCEQVQLAFLDTVFHLAAGAVDPLVQPSGVDLDRGQRGDDEARISLALSPFSLADDAANAAPTVQGGPSEVPEAASRFAGSLRHGPRGAHLSLDLCSQARIARQAENVIHAVGFAPPHQRLATEAAVGAQQNAHPRPTRTDLA